MPVFLAVMMFLAMMTMVLAFAATIIVVAGVAHVVTQRATRAATYGCAQDAARIATDLLADDVATRCAQGSPYGSFGPAAAVSTDHATGSATETCADCSARIAADLLANHGTHRATQRAAQAGFGVAGKGEAAAAQAKGKKQQLQ